MRRLADHGELADALAPYAAVERRPCNGRPWVLANMVCGLDGSTAIGGRVGQLSSPVDRALFVDLRSVADVVLVGAETVRREGYGPVKLSPGLQEDREREGRPGLPRLAIVSRSLSLDTGSGIFRSSDGADRPIILTCETSPDDARARLEPIADVVVAGADRVDPRRALEMLGAAGHEVVLCEGGPSVLGDLLAGGLVDELCLTIAPIVGGDPLPVASMPSSAPTSAFRLAHVLEADDNLFLRYERS